MTRFPPGQCSMRVLRRCVFSLIIISLSVMGIAKTGRAKEVKELPVLVTVEQLSAQPDQYDGHRVVVTGRIRSVEIQTGRRGSEFLLLVLEEDSSATSKTVQVYFPNLPSVKPGDRALVQGTYHREGREAGRPFENFVDAEVVLPDKP